MGSPKLLKSVGGPNMQFGTPKTVVETIASFQKIRKNYENVLITLEF